MQPEAERHELGTIMKPLLPQPSDQRDGKHAVPVCRTAATVMALVLLVGCEQNSFVPPPPPKVDVAAPVQRPVTTTSGRSRPPAA